MILPFFVLLTVISVPLFGGSLVRLGDIRVRVFWAVALALAMQLVIIDILEHVLPHAVASALHLFSYGLAVWFILANAHINGLWIVVWGGALNLIAIAANNGVMPASPAAIRSAGLVSDGGFSNSAATTNARFAGLGDVFALPKRFPLSNVFSIGDVILVIGLAVVFHSACGSRLRRRQPEPAQLLCANCQQLLSAPMPDARQPVSSDR
jgi:Family of unknown function (DUF5317)